MIRTGDGDRISKFIAGLGREIRGIIRSAFELSYFSRGAWSYENVLNMSAVEREIASEFINKRLEEAKKMTFPVF
jgi:hypothetical protein